VTGSYERAIGSYMTANFLTTCATIGFSKQRTNVHGLSTKMYYLIRRLREIWYTEYTSKMTAARYNTDKQTTYFFIHTSVLKTEFKAAQHTT
jgi:hypothetical protein